VDRSTVVSVHDYLAFRRPVRHLVDVAPETQPDAFLPDAGAIGGPLYAMIRAEGQTDVRLLVDDGERYADLATELARNLRCDVYLTPHGVDVRYVRESGFLAADLWDAIAVDRETGDPAQWLVIRPPDLPVGVPTWFVTTRGKLRQSNGLVTVTLPDGLAFATQATFSDTALLAGRMKTGSSPVTTVAVDAGHGRFEISRFDAASALLGGVEFATLVGASLDVVHLDVQLALTWPADPAVCASLHEELTRLAEGLDRTVWVPQPQGAAFVLPGCGEFAAVDEVGGPSEWRPYRPRPTDDWQPRYTTDLDGRLVPLDRSTAPAFPGLAPAPGLYTIDLAVLDDGRLGTGGLVVGPRELRRLLREHGWSGEDLLLLSAPTVAQWAVTIRQLRTVVDMLGVDCWLPAADARVWIQEAGTVAADGPHGGWHVVGYGRSDDAPIDDITPPPVLVRARCPLAALPVVVPLAEPFDETVDETVDEPVAEAADESESVDDGHRISWLPSVPTTNWRAMDLYLWTPLATDHHEAWELPSADLFLLAGQDPLRLADRRRTGYLLRVAVPEETAVDLAEHTREAPPVVRRRVLETGGTHLVPLAWLADLRVTARYDLDGHGGVTARRDIDAGALAIRFEGADHGVPGLPNDVAPWPAKGQRAGLRAYLTVPEGVVHRRQIVHCGYVALTRTKPAVEDGQRVIEVKVRQGRAIDVPATLDRLGGLPVAGRLHDFVGLDLLLPEDELALAVATKAWHTGPTGKPVVDKLGVPLLEALAAEVLEPAA
jgi:hypothetical protein